MIAIHDWDGPSAKTLSLVINGMRNSWESWGKGDSVVTYTMRVEPFIVASGREVTNHFAESEFHLGPADKALALKLLNAGPDHSKFLRQLPITIDFSAPAYFLREFDTYKVSTSCNRTSQMHVLGKVEFGNDMFSWEDMDKYKTTDILNTLNDLRLDWINAGKRKGPNAKEWRAMVQAIPDSFMYRSCWQGSYANLRQMYKARQHHRLREWRDFCRFIETLSFAEFITE